MNNQKLLKILLPVLILGLVLVFFIWNTSEGNWLGISSANNNSPLSSDYSESDLSPPSGASPDTTIDRKDSVISNTADESTSSNKTDNKNDSARVSKKVPAGTSDSVNNSNITPTTGTPNSNLPVFGKVNRPLNVVRPKMLSHPLRPNRFDRIFVRQPNEEEEGNGFYVSFWINLTDLTDEQAYNISQSGDVDASLREKVIRIDVEPDDPNGIDDVSTKVVIQTLYSDHAYEASYPLGLSRYTLLLPFHPNDVYAFDFHLERGVVAVCEVSTLGEYGLDELYNGKPRTGVAGRSPYSRQDSGILKVTDQNGEPLSNVWFGYEQICISDGTGLIRYDLEDIKKDKAEASANEPYAALRKHGYQPVFISSELKNNSTIKMKPVILVTLPDCPTSIPNHFQGGTDDYTFKSLCYLRDDLAINSASDMQKIPFPRYFDDNNKPAEMFMPRRIPDTGFTNMDITWQEYFQRRWWVKGEDLTVELPSAGRFVFVNKRDKNGIPLELILIDARDLKNVTWSPLGKLDPPKKK